MVLPFDAVRPSAKPLGSERDEASGARRDTATAHTTLTAAFGTGESSAPRGRDVRTTSEWLSQRAPRAFRGRLEVVLRG